MAERSPDSVLAIVPAEASSSRVMRAVAATAGAAADLSVDVLQDLGLAVTEAGGVLLRSTVAPSWKLVVTPRAGGLELSVSASATVDDWPPADFDSTLAAGVLRALVGELDFARVDGGVAIRMTFAGVATA